MSIASRAGCFSRSFRSLIYGRYAIVNHIKVLRTLGLFRCRFSIDIKVLQTLRKMGRRTIAGDRPPRYGMERNDERSRGTGPRATVEGMKRRTIAGDRPPRYGKKNVSPRERKKRPRARREKKNGENCAKD